MASYTFKYIEGPNKPSHTVDAEFDSDAFKKIAQFLKKKRGRSLVPGSIQRQEFRVVEDPPDIMAFLRHVTADEGLQNVSRLARSKFKLPRELRNR